MYLCQFILNVLSCLQMYYFLNMILMTTATEINNISDEYVEHLENVLNIVFRLPFAVVQNKGEADALVVTLYDSVDISQPFAWVFHSIMLLIQSVFLIIALLCEGLISTQLHVGLVIGFNLRKC